MTRSLKGHLLPSELLIEFFYLACVWRRLLGYLTGISSVFRVEKLDSLGYRACGIVF